MDVVEAQRWSYLPDVPGGISQVRDLLASYSKIPSTEIDQHLLRVREDGWKVSRFPCIGRWNFLGLLDPLDPLYQQVLFRLRLPGSRDVLLDLGCCVGQVIRQLRADGVQGSQLIGTDIESRFIDIGYDLFQDRLCLGAAFAVGDMLDPDDSRLSALRGKITIVHAASFFHLFSWTQQMYVGKRLVEFLKRGTKNALIFGKQVGITQGSEPSSADRQPFLHSPDTFQRLWNEIGSMTGTRWKVDIRVCDDLDTTSTPGVSKDAVATEFAIYQVS